MEYVSQAVASSRPVTADESSRAVSITDTLYAQVLEPDPSGSGSALTIVLLHPTPLHHAFWLPVAAALPGFLRILPDLRGHGRSALGAAPLQPNPSAPTLTIQQLAADTLALLDTLHIEQAIFVGCSIGGYTLYELWRTAPERIAGLVFCASKPQADTDAERAKRADWIAKLEPARLPEFRVPATELIDDRVPHLSKSHPDGWDPSRPGHQPQTPPVVQRATRVSHFSTLRHGFSLNDSFSPATEFIDAMLQALLSQSTHRDNPALVAEVRAMMEQVRPEAIQAIQRGLAQRPDARHNALTIQVPTCVIAGEEDLSSTPADLTALHTTLLKAGSRSTYHQLPDAGHYAPIEQPATVAAILDTFCRSVVKSAS